MSLRKSKKRVLISKRTARLFCSTRNCGYSYIFYAFIFSLLFISSVYALDVPVLQGYINDYANMMSQQTKAQLEVELKSFENTDSTQIVILTIPSLEGETIEDFGIKVADTWKIGQKNKDNGIIFIVAKQERKIRIEVGRGLEGRLTDLLAGRIIDLVIKPKFKRGDFDGGFIAGTHALIDAVKGEFNSDKVQHSEKNDASKLATFIIFMIIAMLVIGGISRILGSIAGAVGLPLFVLISFSSVGIVALIILAIFGAALGFLLSSLFSSAGYSKHGGFFPGGGFYSGGGGSSGIDFGGFSGGGGGFGGGGASGDW